MHYYVQIEFKNAFHFMYKEWYTSQKKNVVSTFIIKLFSKPICEQSLYFGQMAIIINHLEQPEHGRVWNVHWLFFLLLFYFENEIVLQFPNTA